MNILKSKIGILVVAALVFAGVMLLRDSGDEVQLGNLVKDRDAYSGAATYTAPSLVNNTATSILSRATSSRNIAKICNIGADTVWTFKQATSTNVAVNTGYPIYSSSTNAAQSCLVLDELDPYTGEVWGIATATTTITVETVQE